MDPRLGLLRHALATVAYRARKALDGAPPGFGDYQVYGGVRSPAQLLAHISDVLDWAATHVAGTPEWRESPPLVWDQEIRRFHTSLDRLDAALAHAGDSCPVERLMQGPVADALTHIGQLVMLRRMAGAPLRGENYFKAEIARAGSA